MELNALNILSNVGRSPRRRDHRKRRRHQLPPAPPPLGRRRRTTSEGDGHPVRSTRFGSGKKPTGMQAAKFCLFMFA
jgi:hypothetical protein